MTIVIGLIILVLLLLSMIPNYKVMKEAQANGENNRRAKLMFGVDAILLVLIVVTLIFNIIQH